MPAQNLLSSAAVRHVRARVASATGGDYDTAWVDTQGFDGVTFIATRIGSGATTVNARLRHANSATGADASDVEDSLVGVPAANALVAIEVARPLRRWLQMRVTAPSGAIEDIIAIRQPARDLPVSNTVTGTGGVAHKILGSPDSGDA